MAELPEYDAQLSAFHRAFERELAQIVDSIPLRPEMRVLDLACGDGFYTRLLGARGGVTGVDNNSWYLARARRAAPSARFVAASFDQLPFPDHTFDLVWCAQSLYSLPSPLDAIRHMSRVLRPGGVLAVLENDTLHQVLLPWPASLELPLRAAELRALQQASGPTSRFYVGRRLPMLFAEAGLEPISQTTHAFDRLAPLGEPERELLQHYLRELEERVTPHLEPDALAAFRELVDPNSPKHLLRAPHLSLTWVNALALGRTLI